MSKLQAFVRDWNKNQLRFKRLADTKTFQKDLVHAAKNYAMPVVRRHYIGASELHKPLFALGLKKLGLSHSGLDLSLKLKHIFWTGHMFEALVVLMLESYGCEISHQQQAVKKYKIEGHIDCLCDGDLLEIKTMSGRYFNQFKYGNEDRGYQTQLDFYASVMQTTRAHWLCLNKETIKLALIPQTLPSVRAMEKAKQLLKIHTIEDLYDVTIPAPVTKGRVLKLPFQYVSKEDYLLFYDERLFPRPRQERVKLLEERANATKQK